MTRVFVGNPQELWEMCSGIGGPEISLGAFLRWVSIFLNENRNHLETRKGFGDISVQGILYKSQG